jgi:rhodanese-related sulfurtransferase
MKAFVNAFAVSLLALSATVAAETAPLIAPDKLVERIEKKDSNVVILDVRTPEEFAAGHVPGAKNIPHDQLPNRLAELAGAKDKDIVVYCRSGRRSEMAINTLSSQGFERLLHLDGDMIKWEQEQRPLEK